MTRPGRRREAAEGKSKIRMRNMHQSSSAGIAMRQTMIAPGRTMQLSPRIFAPELRTGRPEARPLKKGPESGYYRFPYDCRSSSAMPQARSSTDKRQPAGGYSTNSRERTGSPNGMITRTSFPSHPHSYRHFLLSRETADTTSPAHTDNTACSKNRAARRTGRSRKRERNHTVSAPLPEIVSTAYLPSES